jgi:acyl-CoA synthetase (AMP-forming)/AMP-acid ligase II
VITEIEAGTIPSVLYVAADRYRDLEAVVDGDQRVTYAALAGAVSDVARALIASGVEPGDRVAIWAPNSLDWIVVSFAIYSCGAILVPLNTRFKGAEAGHVLRTAEVRLLFTVTDFLGTDYVRLLDGVTGLDALAEIVVLHGPAPEGTTSWSSFTERAASVPAGAVEERRQGVQPDDTCDVIFTSGTTGAPKGAMLTHGASVRTYVEWADLVGLRRGDRYLIVYPFFHTAGLKSGVLASLLTGSTIVPHAVFDVDSLVARVQEESITMLPGPPAVFQSMLNDPKARFHDLTTLRLAVTGAASVPVELIRRMREELPFETIVTGYGLTETTGTVTMCRHDDPPEVIALTVGRPLPGIELRIVDDDDFDVAGGEPGEVLVRGFNVMKGYFNDPGATTEAIDPDGWLRTGDVGFVDGGGNLHITDRKKDMFIVGGFNAYPAEIEGIILTRPDVAQVAVVGVPDERMGEVGTAFVVARAGQVIDPDEFLAWCRQKMANFKVPRHVEVVDSLPLNPSGKVMKFQLRERAARGEHGQP